MTNIFNVFLCVWTFYDQIQILEKVVSTVVSGIPFAHFPTVEQVSKGFVWSVVSTQPNIIKGEGKPVLYPPVA